MPLHDWMRVPAGIFHHFHLCWIASISDTLNDGVLPADCYALAEQQTVGEVETMPVHDWTRVKSGIFHDFHHSWIEQIKGALNEGILPPDYYALAEQQAAGFGPDVLTLQGPPPDDEDLDTRPSDAAGGLLVKRPRLVPTAETAGEFHRRKKSTIVVRHVSGDKIVAMLEVISPGNKASRAAFRALLDKACQLLEHRIHLLLLDLFPPGRRDPHGLHSALWEEITDETFEPAPDKPLAMVAYESALTVKAYLKQVAVGDVLPVMPLFLEPDGCVDIPLEATYQAAFAKVPRRWRTVLEAAAPEME